MLASLVEDIPNLNDFPLKLERRYSNLGRTAIGNDSRVDSRHEPLIDQQVPLSEI